MDIRKITFMAGLIFATLNSAAFAWDHPGHMTTAAIAYAEVERQRPELMDKIGMLFLAHPEPAPFWVAAGAARGKEATRRKFIECARFADDIKFSAEFPAGNAAAAMSYVEDPVNGKPIPLHILWDSNALRSPKLEDVDRYAGELMKKYPRSSFPELLEHPYNGPDAFTTWARESYSIAAGHQRAAYYPGRLPHSGPYSRSR